MYNRDMMKPKLPILLSLILPLFLSPSHVSSSEPHFIFSICLNKVGNYTENSPFQANLNALFKSLTNESATSNFMYDVIGEEPDQASMIYNCRGDLNGQDCYDCVTEATKSIAAKCPNQKEAIIWYEECMLRYSNRTLLGLEEESPLSWEHSLDNVSDPTVFGQVLAPKILSVIKVAAYNDSDSIVPNVFAVGEADVPPSVISNISFSDKVYCLAQCTRDIVGVRCERCLRAAFAAMAGCCGTGRQSMQLYFPSCQLRYSILPFIRSEASPGPSSGNTSQPASPSKGDATTMTIEANGNYFVLGLIIAVNMLLLIPSSY